MAQKEVVRILKEFHKAIEKEGIPVAKMVLYGSQATGRVRDDSDIDVAVISPVFGKNRIMNGTRLFQIACGIDPRIEPIPLSVKEYERDTWLPLIYEIRTNGIEVTV